MPYDRFVPEQLAGDELPDGDRRLPRRPPACPRSAPLDDEPADPVMDRFDELDDMVTTIGTRSSA